VFTAVAFVIALVMILYVLGNAVDKYLKGGDDE